MTPNASCATVIVMGPMDRSLNPSRESAIETIRDIFAGVRAVRLYPANNPLYSRSISRSYKAITDFLGTHPELTLIIQKTGLFFGDQPIEKEPDFLRSLAADIYSRGIRQISFLPGITESELRGLYTILSMPLDDLRLKGSTAALLWEMGVGHIKVREAELDSVIKAPYESTDTAGPVRHKSLSADATAVLRTATVYIFGKEIVIGDILDDPISFSRIAVELAEAGPDPGLRLLEIYKEAGRTAASKTPESADILFDAIAVSIHSMDAAWKTRFIAGVLYPELDKIALHEHIQDRSPHLPSDMHELASARISKDWRIPELSGAVKRLSQVPARAGSGFGVQPVPPDMQGIARELSEYTPAEMEELKKLSDLDFWEDTLDAAVSVLIQLLPVIERMKQTSGAEAALSAFLRVMDQLEDALFLFLDKREYRFAAVILRAFRMLTDPLFARRIQEAVRKAGDVRRIRPLVHELRILPKDSDRYKTVTAYLSLLDREATPALLEMLAVEDDRSMRKILVNILKDLGKNQIAILGERLSDERWYFVRNIIGILGDSRKEEAVDYLATVAGHRNFQIRQEVVRALVTIGGKRASRLLARFLTDRDIDIRFMAARGLGSVAASGEEEERALITVVRGGLFRKQNLDLRLEAIASLGKIGKETSILFLRRSARLRFWMLRKTRHAVSAAAKAALAEIERRLGHA